MAAVEEAEAEWVAAAAAAASAAEETGGGGGRGGKARIDTVEARDRGGAEFRVGLLACFDGLSI